MKSHRAQGPMLLDSWHTNKSSQQLYNIGFYVLLTYDKYVIVSFYQISDPDCTWKCRCNCKSNSIRTGRQAGPFNKLISEFVRDCRRRGRSQKFVHRLKPRREVGDFAN